MSTFNRLTKVFNSSMKIPIDSSSKLILMSDCHRGDNSWADDFAHNSNIMYTALNHYFNNGFTYIEIGDSDELWENRNFSTIRSSHSHIFELMRKFYLRNRLYMIWGNHDIVKKKKRFVEKNLYSYYDDQKDSQEPLFENIEVHEGLILEYKEKGNSIFLVHGHQGDLMNDYFWWLTRFLVRYVWRPLELYLGFNEPTSPAKNFRRKRATEKRILKWVKAKKQMLIAGHTHRPTLPDVGQPLYFNDGSCVHPRGITGIEIENGKITLVKWGIRSKDSGILFVGREIISGPQRLEAYFNSEFHSI